MEWVFNGSSRGGKGGVALLGPFTKDTNHLPKTLPPNTISLKIRFQHINLQGREGAQYPVYREKEDWIVHQIIEDAGEPW